MIKQGMNILEQNQKKRLDFNPDLQSVRNYYTPVYAQE